VFRLWLAGPIGGIVQNLRLRQPLGRKDKGTKFAACINQAVMEKVYILALSGVELFKVKKKRYL
jgi:hypothetical protein